jgi:type 1 glutamine amidotransferase
VVERRMLVLTEVAPYREGPAGVHGVLVQAATGLAQLGRMVGLDPQVVPTVRELEPDDLAHGVLALFTIGETPFTGAQRQAVSEAWRSGDLAVLGVHSATDACHDWDDYGRLLGARFDGHPYTQSFEISVEDGDHPATAHLGATWSWYDEVYLFAHFVPDARVLLRVGEGQVDLAAAGRPVPECGLPLSWCRREGRGRSFYSALGHFAAAWEDPTYLRHLAGGLEWLLDEDRDDAIVPPRAD